MLQFVITTLILLNGNAVELKVPVASKFQLEACAGQVLIKGGRKGGGTGERFVDLTCKDYSGNLHNIMIEGVYRL